ncbi:MAG: nuclear transport factor 2 family protein [Bradyrhizobium sp.]|nr:nuclear transport factor 2 family protein [Bradyrhizobium sp.]
MTECWVAASSLLVRVFRSLDRRDYDTLVSCFADHGSWTRQGKTSTGASQILEGLTSRPTTLHTVHIVQNVLVENADISCANISFSLTVYRYDTPAPPPFQPPQPSAIGDCNARLERMGDAWRIRDLKTGPYLFVS